MGRVALVTGGTRGIGAAISTALKEAGFRVAANYGRNDEAAEAFRAETGILVYRWDVSDFEACEAGVTQVRKELGEIDVLVNNASIVGKRVTLDELDVATWDDVLKVNTSSLFYLTRPLIAHFKRQRGASIINVSSTVGRIGKPRWGAYAVSKFGVEGFTQVLASELGPEGVRVNAVNPGATRTGMRAAAYPEEDPMTLPTPEQVAEVFVYLASDASSELNGQTLEARDYFQMNPSS